MTNPITPPPELLDKWCMDNTLDNWRDIATQAAQWGADQELEACCRWTAIVGGAEALRAARRPKPPSLKEQALHELADVYDKDKIDDFAYTTIRRALEALDD